ncbi:MAG: type II secretion system protein [Chthonomonadales bacterium]
MNSNRRILGFSLVEILVVLAILVAMSAFIVPRLVGKASIVNGKKVPTPMSRAHDTECISNIRSVRQAIAVAKTSETEEKNPASLSELKLPAEILKCAEGHQPYVYDPRTGEVHCPQIGHEKF